MKYLIGFLIFFITIQLSAQSLESIERDLEFHFKNIEKDYQADRDKIDYDDIILENDIFTAKLIYYLNKQSKTISYNFINLVNDRFRIFTSADKKFRIYNWAINLGGRQDFIYNIYQYQNKLKIGVWGDKENNYEGSYVIDIFESDLNGKHYYFPYMQSAGSENIAYQYLYSYSISEYGLESDEPLFKLGEEPQSSIIIGFDFFSVLDHEERPVRLIKFNAKTKTFTQPFIDPKTLKVSLKKTEKYKFNGKYFE